MSGSLIDGPVKFDMLGPSILDELEQEATHELQRIENVAVHEQHDFDESLGWNTRACLGACLNFEIP